MKKILILVFSTILFSACLNIDKQYKYKAMENMERLSIVGMMDDIYSENSPLSNIWISDSKNWDGKKRKVKLLNNKVKIVKNGKKYIIPYSNPNNYKDIFIYIYKNGVNITDGDFIAYIGKVQLDTGEIINIPPLHFEKYIYIQKTGMFGAFDSVGKIKSYSGTVEEYKKNGWIEE